MGTGGYIRRVSIRHLSRYFISRVSWNVAGLSLSPKISSNSWSTFSWTSGWQPIIDRKKLDPEAVVSCPCAQISKFIRFSRYHKRLVSISLNTYFKHDGVYLFLDLRVGQNNAVLAGLDQQVEERLPLLLAYVIVIDVQVVLQTRRLTEGKTLNGGVLQNGVKLIMLKSRCV